MLSHPHHTISTMGRQTACRITHVGREPRENPRTRCNKTPHLQAAPRLNEGGKAGQRIHTPEVSSFTHRLHPCYTSPQGTLKAIRHTERARTQAGRRQIDRQYKQTPGDSGCTCVLLRRQLSLHSPRPRLPSQARTPRFTSRYHFRLRPQNCTAFPSNT